MTDTIIDMNDPDNAYNTTTSKSRKFTSYSWDINDHIPGVIAQGDHIAFKLPNNNVGDIAMILVTLDESCTVFVGAVAYDIDGDTYALNMKSPWIIDERSEAVNSLKAYQEHFKGEGLPYYSDHSIIVLGTPFLISSALILELTAAVPGLSAGSITIVHKQRK